jgi:hypothetical protein
MKRHRWVRSEITGWKRLEQLQVPWRQAQAARSGSVQPGGAAWVQASGKEQQPTAEAAA